MASPLEACASVRDVVAGVRGSCRRERRDADRADVYDDESEDASKRREVTLVLVSQRALSCKRGKAWPSIEICTLR